VNGSYFNFSVPEPTGVVGMIAPEDSSLLGLVSRLAPIIVSGNAAVVLASESRPLPAVTLTEVLATSDVPGGVVNMITGLRRELVQHLAAHMDVNALDAYGLDPAQGSAIEDLAVENVKRLVRPAPENGAVDWLSEAAQSPYLIGEYVEVKTVWHPIGS
jgi:acyl-CoA reductase-like NAD-dependent aldehyde dehydrogenase